MNVSAIANRRTQNTVNRRDIGRKIRYIDPTENEVYRDATGDIAGRPPKGKVLTAFPIQTNPTPKQRDRAGVKENINCIVWISKKEYEAKISKDLVDIIRHKIVITGSNGRDMNYEIDTAKYHGTISTGHRYVIIAGIEQT